MTFLVHWMSRRRGGNDIAWKTIPTLNEDECVSAKVPSRTLTNSKRATSQAWPRFWGQGSILNWKWCLPFKVLGKGDANLGSAGPSFVAGNSSGVYSWWDRNYRNADTDSSTNDNPITVDVMLWRLPICSGWRVRRTHQQQPRKFFTTDSWRL